MHGESLEIAPLNSLKSKSKEQTKLESTSKGLLKRKLDSDDTLSRVTYKDAIATDGCENALHLSDEINCNSPNPNVIFTCPNPVLLVLGFGQVG
jgi:hypothetical protein